MPRIVLVVLAFAFAAPASANMGRRDLPGVRSVEPGGLREIAIEREELVLDLRPIAERGGAPVSATYHLDNRGTTTVTAPLVFVSGASRLDNFQVLFDGKAVPQEHVTEDKVAAFPASWRAPLTTPSLDGGAPLPFWTEDGPPYAFTLEISPGRHTLAVTYRAVPQQTRSRSEATTLWQLGYVLAPARDWGSFGTLDVRVEVPAGWRIATSPALARTGDTLRAQFPSLPADTIGITLHAPTGTLHAVLQIALPLLALLVVAGGGFAMFAIGRARGRNTEDLRKLWPVSLPASLLWAVAVGITGGLAALRSTFAVPDGQMAAGYGAGFSLILVIPAAFVAIPIGVLIAHASRAAYETRGDT